MENYSDQDFTHIHPTNLKGEYRKFALVIFSITALSVAVTLVRHWSARQLLDDFMAIFFITFACFKFIHLEDFVLTYRTYDKLSQRIRPWAYIFPFIEAILGFAYLLEYRSSSLNLITLLVTAAAGYSVWKVLYANRSHRSRFRCACLGNVIKLPLTTVSFVEDGLMFAMAALMLFI